MNKLTIEFDNKTMGMGLEEPQPVVDTINTLMQGIDLVIAQLLEQADKDGVDVQEVRRDFYDIVNGMATNLLERIDPTATSHPNLTEVGILLAENELMKQAEANGMTLAEYLPLAKVEQEKAFKIFKLNEDGRRRHLKKTGRK